MQNIKRADSDHNSGKLGYGKESLFSHNILTTNYYKESCNKGMLAEYT